MEMFDSKYNNNMIFNYFPRPYPALISGCQVIDILL